jgi:Predicted nucleotide-binding protein containing TIR-like domain
MTLARIFIASSSEGLPEATALRDGLQRRLDGKADVRLWTTEFELSRTYIEALEARAAEADFALAVFSADDRVTSRAQRRHAPRDNVVFELGLFIGALGRPRCFLVHRQDVDLKLPSDLLAVVSAAYTVAPGQALADALAVRCDQIALRVQELGALRRISPAAMVRREQSLALADQVAGNWWERIRVAGSTSISFFRIDYDDATETLRLRGQAYDASGEPWAHWSGFAVELVPERRRIVYRWTGTHTETAHTQFHGIGEVEFDPPAAGQPAQRGHGRFWDVDESRPENTRSKAVELQRETDPEVVARMLQGRAADRLALTTRILAAW